MSVFVHEPFSPPRRSSLRVGVIADGTTRGGPNGIADGAMRVVECAERCAERDDVALLAAFILSPQNVIRRKRAFFAGLHAEFLRLAEGVASGRVLAGTRIETHGRLDRLAKGGGAAARLAHVIELLCETTEAIEDPRLRLVFCIDYEEDTPLALGLDVLIRTGMEQSSVLRLSGLRVQPRTVCIPHVKLWRNFTATDLDRALTLATRQARLGFAPGFSSQFIADLVAELSRARFPTPLRITLPFAASTEETAAFLVKMAGGPLHPESGVAVTAVSGPHDRRRRIGPRRAPVQVRLVAPGLRAPEPLDEPVVWLAPRQPSPVFCLLERSAGDANIHACEATPAGIVAGLWRALRFQEAHPPLHGAPRPLRLGSLSDSHDDIANLIDRLAGQADIPATVIVREFDGPDGSDSGLDGKIFAARCVLDARASGLFSGQVDWTRQAFGYAMTAFAIGSRPPDGIRLHGDDWEPATRAAARVMLALASSDEEITDRVFPGEDDVARRRRLEASIEYLIAKIHCESREPPDVTGRDVLRAIGSIWESYFTMVASAAEEEILCGARRAAEALYRANLEEMGRVDPPLTSLVQRRSTRPVDLAERFCAASAPEPVARRVCELLRVLQSEPMHGSAENWRELRLLCRLARVAPSIGAGCALLAMAATEPARTIPAGGAAAFLRVTPLIDHYFRLANDLAFEDAIRGDRDDKLSTFMCLIPADLTGKARERACIDALRTCRATAAWLEEQIWNALGELSRLWPLGARWLQRGIHVGRRAYERGHYARLDADAIAGIVAETAAIPPAA